MMKCCENEISAAGMELGAAPSQKISMETPVPTSSQIHVKLLKSAINGDLRLQHLTSFVINDSVVVDAGSIGFSGDLAQQAKVRHVFVSHSHIDHIASLPIFIENVFEGTRENEVTVYGSQPVLDALRAHVFNDVIWPDFIRLSEEEDLPFMRIQPLEANKPVTADGIRVTPIPVSHIVPTQAFVIETNESAIIIAGDTGPTEQLWRVAAELPNLKAVFLEATFPDNMSTLAEVSMHLTPACFVKELKKFNRHDVQVFAVHLKARQREKVTAELNAIALPQMKIAVPGDDYTF